MNWFLRLFPSYRALIAESAAKTTAIHELKESLAAVRAEKAVIETAWQRAEQRASDALAHERRTYQFYENVRTQERFGGTVIPHLDAPHLPVDTVKVEETGPVNTGFTTGSQAVAAANADFSRRYANFFQEHGHLVGKS